MLYRSVNWKSTWLQEWKMYQNSNEERRNNRRHWEYSHAGDVESGHGKYGWWWRGLGCNNIPQEEYETSDKRRHLPGTCGRTSGPTNFNNRNPSPMSRYEKTRSSSKICDDTVDVNTNQVLYKLQCWKDTCEQEGSQTGYLIINDNY